MYLLDGLLGPLVFLVPVVLDVETGKDHAGIVKAGSAALAYLDLAGLLLVFPNARCTVFAAADERGVRRAQINAGYAVSVTDERAQDVVVVQRPVHDSIVVVSLACRQDALIVVSKLDQIDTVALTEVGVDFLAALKVEETY